MQKLKVLSLFAGIGGFDLGLERTGGFKTVAFCEIDKAAARRLAKHWPEVTCYDDVSKLTGERLRADGITVDCIVGGFPCQDISTAGHGAGIEGKRSGLWSEYARLIRELRPSIVIVENVSALLSRGLGRVLGDLASLGLDAWWECVRASDIGARHHRDRVWIVAYRPDFIRDGRAIGEYLRAWILEQSVGGGGGVLSNTERGIGEAQHKAGLLGQPDCKGASARLADGYLPANWQWRVEPSVGRVADGVPDRVDRLKQLGNAVVPQIPELIGNAILASLAEDKDAA